MAFTTMTSRRLTLTSYLSLGLIAFLIADILGSDRAPMNSADRMSVRTRPMGDTDTTSIGETNGVTNMASFEDTTEPTVVDTESATIGETNSTTTTSKSIGETDSIPSGDTLTKILDITVVVLSTDNFFSD